MKAYLCFAALLIITTVCFIIFNFDSFLNEAHNKNIENYKNFKKETEVLKGEVIDANKEKI